MKSARYRITEQQRQWATRAKVRASAKGYLPTVEANLWKPLHPKTRMEFQSGSGSELRNPKGRLAKMRALHSSAALACNFFDFWRERDKAVLTQALELTSPIVDLRFEMQLPTGLRGTPPNLDLFLALASGEFVAVESKFTEQYAAKSNTPPFKAKYVADKVQLWADVGLQSCQRLVTGIVDGEQAFDRLNCAQLLKHALDAARHHSRRVSLLYLFYDDDGSEGTQHRADIVTFCSLLNGELGFRALSYQELFRRIEGQPVSGGLSYLKYLKEHYFPDVPPVS
jgi:hypothetical protein